MAMDLLNIASQFITSKEGLKIFKKIKGLDLEQLKSAVSKKKKGLELSKEDKTALKEEKKQQLGEKTAKYTPYYAIFTTRGIVYNKRTKEPIEGVQVNPFGALYPILKQERVNPVTKEILKDENGKILYKAKSDKGAENFTVTNDKGEWELTFGVPYIDAANRIVLPPNVAPFVLYKESKFGAYTSTDRTEGKENDYAPGLQYIVTFDGQVPKDQDPIGLTDLIDAAEQEAAKQIQNIVDVVAKEANKYLDVVERTLVSLTNLVLKPTTVIQTTLLPLAVRLMLYFGIAKQQQAEQQLQKCPNGEALAEVIRKRNSVVRQINNIYGIIAANTALAFLFLYLSKYLIVIKNVIGNIPFPVSVPPGVGVPYSLISKLEGIQELLEKLSGINKELKKNLFIALIFLIISLIIILRYLKTIDNLIGECSDGDSDGDNGLLSIDDELLALQTQTALDGEPELKIVNGFTMDVEVVDKYQVGDLPRRQAIARNSKGIIILKGEPSFAAENQILIDELAFYIVQNNLKAD
tara:strand:+ start:5743 stop:7311 length:1569 start_codon:yes stop_codon:yes gene_type:complete